MTYVIQTFHHFEHTLDDRFTYMLRHHPYLSMLLVFIGMPMILLAVLFLFTSAIALPIAWLMGAL